LPFSTLDSLFLSILYLYEELWSAIDLQQNRKLIAEPHTKYLEDQPCNNTSNMSQLGDKVSGSGSDAGGRPISGKDVILKLADPTPKRVKHQSPQDAIDEFWKKFDTKTPGIGMSF